MTDQMDHRLEELVTRLAASAPEAPPFPRVAEQPLPPTRRNPAWVLAAAGAAVFLVIIGLPFLLLSGGSVEPDVATTSATPTPTTAPPPATTTPTAPDIAACTPAGLLVRALDQDGAAGHVVTPLRFINVSRYPCRLDQPLGVTGIGTGGEEVPAGLGTVIPIGGDPDSLIKSGDSLVMLVEVGTGCEGGRAVGPEADSVRISLATGDVVVPFAGDLGCNFSYSPFGEWGTTDPPTAEERGLAGSLGVFAMDPTAERHGGIPFSDPVTLTLGPGMARTQSAASLADPGSWVFGGEADGFRAHTGPFSALDLLARGGNIEVTAGPHDHCAGPPMAVHADLAGLRQISIQPTGASSCLEWWVVDLFLTDDGEIAGVTLDLWEP